MSNIRKAIPVTVGLFLLLSSCNKTSTEQIPTEEPVGLPNPASVYCEEQGGTLELRTDADGGQYGVCIFADGSECEEWAYFREECQPGDSTGDQPLEDVGELTTEIVDPTSARQAIVTYLIEYYAIEIVDEWEEFDGSPDESSTVRFISGPWIIALTPDESAIDSPSYTVEIGQISGFHWEGTIDANGEIHETSYIPPATILTADQARDAAVAYLVNTYALTAPQTWIEQQVEQDVPGFTRKLYTSEAWVVEVLFAPAAPIVPSYQLIIDNLSEVLRWEGEVSSRGEITETQFIQN